jgi:hypothetical protein
MPDVAVILGLPNGQASFTVQPNGGDTVTKPGSRRWIFGPSQTGVASYVALCQLQIPSTDAGQTANTYRYVGDQLFNGAAPTTWSYFGNAFVSLGGI